MTRNMTGNATRFAPQNSQWDARTILQKTCLLCFLCLLLGAGSLFAITGSNDPNDFMSFNGDWCYVFSGCSGQVYPSPQQWTLGPYSGSVYLETGQPMQVFSEEPTGIGWYGNLIDRYGVVYNGVETLGNNPGSIVLSFATPIAGTGAYIQANYYGPFIGSIQLFDSSWTQVGTTYFETGYSDNNVGTAIYIGAYDDINDISYAVFDTPFGTKTSEDFGITMVGFRLAQQPTPEPGTLLLLGPALLGLGSVLRRRMTGRPPKAQ